MNQPQGTWRPRSCSFTAFDSPQRTGSTSAPWTLWPKQDAGLSPSTCRVSLTKLQLLLVIDYFQITASFCQLSRHICTSMDQQVTPSFHVNWISPPPLPLPLSHTNPHLSVLLWIKCFKDSVSQNLPRLQQRLVSWPLPVSWRRCVSASACSRWWWSARPSVGCTPSRSSTSTRTWSEPTSPLLPSAQTNSRQSSTRALRYLFKNKFLFLPEQFYREPQGFICPVTPPGPLVDRLRWPGCSAGRAVTQEPQQSGQYQSGGDEGRRTPVLPGGPGHVAQSTHGLSAHAVKVLPWMCARFCHLNLGYVRHETMTTDSHLLYANNLGLCNKQYKYTTFFFKCKTENVLISGIHF